MPALRPPPTATVATGTPGGICTIASSESKPSNALPKIGTPMTGRVVNAAVTPGRCAAPPAPAMMTFSPRAIAVETYSSSPRGSRWAEMTLASLPMPNSASASAAAFIVGQSESLPIRMPTRGELVLLMF